MEENVLTLAYLGDSVYELYIREYLISKKIIKIKDLQEQAINYVSAKAQAIFLDDLLKSNFLTEDEENIVYRSRNHKVNHKPKNTDILTYKHATALESLIGYLYMKNRKERLTEIINFIIGRV